MKKIFFAILFSLGYIFFAQAQGTRKESAKILNSEYKERPSKQDRKVKFNKYDSSFNKKLSKQKRKETTTRRRKAKNNSRVRTMEMQHNKRNTELARKMELRERKRSQEVKILKL